MGQLAKPYVTDLKQLLRNDTGRLSEANIAKLRSTIQGIDQLPEVEADCCNTFALGSLQKHRSSRRFMRKGFRQNFLLEDQEGKAMTLEQLLIGKITLVAFFYTRCENPEKCSLTISNLVSLQSRATEIGYGDRFNIAAISYDSFYDKPHVLKQYGEARGLKWNENTKLLRATSDFNELSEFFALNVNFTGSVVNRHAIELYLIDERGTVVKSFERTQMNVDDIIGKIVNRIDTKPDTIFRITSKVKQKAGDAANVLISLFFALLPKCPFCLAAYLSVLGVTGLQISPYFKYLLPIMSILMITNLYSLYKMAIKRSNYLPFILSVSGSSLLIIARYLLQSQKITIVAIIVLLTGVIMNGLPKRFRFWEDKIYTAT
jgi:protein SCO1/2